MKSSILAIVTILTAFAAAAPAPQTTPPAPLLTFYCFVDASGNEHAVYCEAGKSLASFGSQWADIICGDAATACPA